MAFVLKIKYENSLRRLSLQQNEIESESFKFAQLESRIRELFQLPASAPLSVTYTDEENDVITMGNDEDLKDALVEQALNPLRILVTLLKPKSGDQAETRKAVPLENVDDFVSHLRRALSSCPETVGVPVKQAFETYAAQVASAVRNGAAAASAAAAAAVQGPQLQRRVGPFGGPATTFFGGPSTFEGANQPYRKAGPFGGPSTTSFGGPPMSEGVNQPHRGAGPSGGPSTAFFGGPPMFEGADSEKDGSVNVHHGVACDGCGVTPIVGDRWKSKKKFDYDLCGNCFEVTGNEEEYSKIVEPKFRPRQMVRSHMMGHPFHPMKHGHFPHGGRPSGMRGPFGSAGRHQWGSTIDSCRGEEKLYGRFVCDVTVFDGTEVAPETRFVKIWRLRNSGLSPWPVNTSLAFVGGDDIGHLAAVPLEIPEEGLAPEAEIEASVDMVAPEKPGRYVSHWRLASPAGPKFGQRLSVIIQVVPKTTLDGITTELVSVGDDASTQEVESGAGSSSPPPAEVLAVIKELSQKEIPSPVSVPELESGAGTSSQTSAENLTVVKELSESENLSPVNVPVVLPEEATENVAAVAELGVEEKKAVSNTSEVSAAVEGSITYPVLGGAQNQDPIAYPVVDVGVSSESAEKKALLTTKALLSKLEVMGFTDSKLNAELLEKNDCDLRKTLDDLCAAEEWDPILEELEEMGFYDTVMNRRLMFKNNGSVKNVVKELLQMYRDIQAKREKVE